MNRIAALRRLVRALPQAAVVRPRTLDARGRTVSAKRTTGELVEEHLAAAERAAAAGDVEALVAAVWSAGLQFGMAQARVEEAARDARIDREALADFAEALAAGGVRKLAASKDLSEAERRKKQRNCTKVKDWLAR